MQIKTRDDLEQAIDQLITRDLAFKDIHIDLKAFDADLKTLIIRFSGEHTDGTISTPMMKACLDLQSKLNQNYCDLHHRGNGRKLKHDEKEQLTLHFKVEKGSTHIEANIADIFQLFIDKMTPEQITTTIITVGASYVIGLGIKAVVNDRANARKSALEEKIACENNQTKRDELAHQLELAKIAATNTDEAFQRYENLTKLLSSEDKHEHVKALEHQKETAEKLIQAGSATGDLTVGGLVIPQETLAVIGETERQESTIVRLDGPYMVRVVDATEQTVFKVEVQHIETHEQFVATVQDDTSNNKHNQFIRDALGAKSPLYLRIHAKEKRGKINDAVIIEAELIGDD